MGHQAAQCGCQLIERRFCQPFGIQLRQDGFAAQQHIALQVALQPFVLTLSPRRIRAPQIAFFRQPVAQGRNRDLQHIADQGGIAIMLVDLVERVDLGFQRITARHGRFLCDWDGKLKEMPKTRPPAGNGSGLASGRVRASLQSR